MSASSLKYPPQLHIDVDFPRLQSPSTYIILLNPHTREEPKAERVSDVPQITELPNGGAEVSK